MKNVQKLIGKDSFGKRLFNWHVAGLRLSHDRKNKAHLGSDPAIELQNAITVTDAYVRAKPVFYIINVY